MVITRHSIVLVAGLVVAPGCMPEYAEPEEPDNGGGTGGGGGDGTGGGTGGMGGTGGGAGNARSVFDAEVAPILEATCSEATCHGGTGTSPLKFIPPTRDQYYPVVTGYQDRVVGYFDKNTAPMLRRIVPGPHYTASYDAAEEQAVAGWLDAEVTARMGDGGGGGTNPPAGPTPGEVSAQLIREWSGCMELTTWQQEDVADRWANKGSSEGPCIQCHINGQASFIATDDDTRMFTVVTTNKYFMLPYFTPDVTDLSNPRMVINRDIFERVGSATYPFIEHPLFEVDGQAFQQLTSFYELTMQRKAANTCDPPRITD